MPDELVNVRYMVDDVESAVAFYTTHFGFTVRSDHGSRVRRRRARQPATAARASPEGSAGRPMPDGRTPAAGRLRTASTSSSTTSRTEVERLRAAGLTFRNDIVSGPGGRQILLRTRRQPDRAVPACLTRCRVVTT